jgi:uncharacterized protein YqgC (DUF456 family)
MNRSTDRDSAATVRYRMAMLHWLCFVILLVVLFAGLIINVFTLPGNWLMLAAVSIYALLTPLLTPHMQYVGVKSLGVMLVLAIIGEVVETLAASRAVKKQGGSRWGSIGAIVGGILGGILLTGLFPVPVLGTLCGILLGTFAGAMLLEVLGGKQIGRSALIGYGAARGRLVGSFVKFTIGCVIFLIAMIVAIPWHG